MKPNFIVLSIIIILFIACKKDNSEQIPIAEFTFFTSIRSDSIQFIDKSINATNWHWDFGDTTNVFSTEQNPIYLYKYDNFSHNVTLTVSNSTGKTSTIQHQTTLKR